jgi:hypothetical protein
VAQEGSGYSILNNYLYLNIEGEYNALAQTLGLQLDGTVEDSQLVIDLSDINYASNTTITNWREIIYQMAKDYSKYNYLSDFESRVAAANPVLYPRGRTGYE